jgi:hypothetical protein
MPEKFQPGFMYIKSEKLKQEVAFSLKSGWVYCEDKGPDGKLVNYSPEELKILNADGKGKITMSVHNVKKIFGGRLVQCSRLDQVDLEGCLLASRFVVENIGFGWGCSKFPLVLSAGR